MGGQHGITGTNYDSEVPIITADYHVSGILNPNATCNYDITGQHDGKNYLRRKDGSWFVWWSILYDCWFITALLGEFTGPYWLREQPVMEGDYDAGPGASGIATLSPGAH